MNEVCLSCVVLIAALNGVTNLFGELPVLFVMYISYFYKEKENGSTKDWRK